jgi:hypothetical protein
VSFILSNERDRDAVRAFERYRNYLQSVRHSLPESVFALASSDWYFSPSEHRCPHDAWLESVTISELSSGERRESRFTSIRIRLLGPYHNGVIEFVYPRVFRYSLDASAPAGGHRDWRYDEFRLSERGYVIHEIEWEGAQETARWVIESSDVHFQWHPKEQT